MSLEREVTQTFALIKELTVHADHLLVKLRGNGASWSELAALINPEDPPTRSSVQRRVEAADRREAERHISGVMAQVEERRRMGEAVRSVAVPLLSQVVASVTYGPGPRLHDLDPHRYIDGADTLDAVVPPLPDAEDDLRSALVRASRLLREAGTAIATCGGIATERYREEIAHLSLLAPDPADREAVLKAAGLGLD
ncbi:hypothetical protein HUT11_35605 (plasmid) [Streptomyces seoulensis]|nr:hypothetical protein HUT11_35605 [Streptomyces seoulensis]